MHSTKTEILSHLTRCGGATVDSLASSLGLAPMTVRQHLVALERDGAVRSEEVRRAMGRPHLRYALTEDGSRKLRDGHDRLVALLVARVGELELNGEGPQRRREELFRAAAKALAAEHRDRAKTLSPGERVELAARLLREHGGFAEHHEMGGGAIELRDFSCVYREAVTHEGPCAWHRTLLGELLGPGVEAVDRDDDERVAMCRFVIQTGEEMPARDSMRGAEA